MVERLTLNSRVFIRDFLLSTPTARKILGVRRSLRESLGLPVPPPVGVYGSLHYLLSLAGFHENQLAAVPEQKVFIREYFLSSQIAQQILARFGWNEIRRSLGLSAVPQTGMAIHLEDLLIAARTQEAETILSKLALKRT